MEFLAARFLADRLVTVRARGLRAADRCELQWPRRARRTLGAAGRLGGRFASILDASLPGRTTRNMPGRWARRAVESMRAYLVSRSPPSAFPAHGSHPGGERGFPERDSISQAYGQGPQAVPSPTALLQSACYCQCTKDAQAPSPHFTQRAF